jgi:ornithine cyclodeaminase
MLILNAAQINALAPAHSMAIVSCATSGSEPLLLARWLKAGCFVGLVGSFSPINREADDDVILRSRVFVDTYGGALKEAGDLLDPLKRKIIARKHIVGEITLFKSVGTPIEDLALAHLVVEAGGGACFELGHGAEI